MLNIGGAELLIILLVALVVLGPERLPAVARQVGQTVSSLRSLASGFQAEMEAASKPDGASDAVTATSGEGAQDPSQDEMTLTGPTSTDDAIAQTQGTDPAQIAAAARQVRYDDEDGEKSSGGPTPVVQTRDDVWEDEDFPNEDQFMDEEE